MTAATPRILVLAGSATDGEALGELLQEDYPDARIATQASDFAAIFERYQPDVLVLALRTVAESEQLHRAVVGQVRSIVPAPYKTLLLCDHRDVARAYALCKANLFDDYILFWPMAHDASRLAMSIHHALRFLAATRAAGVLPGLTLHARRLGNLQEALEQEHSTGNLHIQRARDAIEAVGTDIRMQLDRFGRRMIETGLDASVTVRDGEAVLRELDRFDLECVKPPIAAALANTVSVRHWAETVTDRLLPQRQAARALGHIAASVRPLLLVVDDDDFMRKLLLRLLQTGGYEVAIADSAMEAVAFLRARKPDLILMDVRLPDTDGIELTKQLKSTDAFSAIPIVMLTGQGQRQVLIDSRQAGAIDFVVKPFDRETLLKKVAQHLSLPT